MHPDKAYEHLPSDSSGVYGWWVRTDALESIVPRGLPGIGKGSLIYLGKANRLRSRAAHHRGTSSSSSLRRNLAGTLGLQAQRLPRAKHPRLIPKHEELLNDWMRANLEVSWCVVRKDHKALEKSLLTTLQPPMNVDPPETDIQHWVWSRLQELKSHALTAAS